MLTHKPHSFNRIDPTKGLISTDSSFASGADSLNAAGNWHRNQGLRVVYQRARPHYKRLGVSEARILAPLAHFPPRKELNGLIHITRKPKEITLMTVDLLTKPNSVAISNRGIRHHQT